ncbi:MULTISPECIES: NADH-quinone oxidoreductase subunit M [unclassified Wenzhouxiangella]|uniref:NADH-quinone oxidoreductase subunit M n=1 Tax=unclassified Wenzhouxiangella TaxID=2613841 RepID=UPI000E32D007|nr:MULTISPECIES: NADH-quinone oxidoreductase subunit M [unclassified Wenzhouxiangella]RFF28448.1 NADH-quinone oxidoreductase subunit M [Wenzhouxiangella sp. 15181]RFP69965.1 NADH-quinone oxidoreductase subunit M [Wenzhouxiangella sp. 15190]
MLDWPLLSLLTWIPIAGAVVVAALGQRSPDMVRPLALIVALVTFGLSLLLYVGFDASTAQMQFVEKTVWIEAFNIHYHLGIDGLSLPLILLNTLICVLVIVGGWGIKDRPHQYMAAFLMLHALMTGMFAALDALLFYVFFEAILVPMFLIIGIWGGPNRIYATVKFFLFTFFGSVFMLIALLWLYLDSGSFAVADLQQHQFGLTAQILVFLAFLIAFAVKVPMWPVHTWLPDAHVEAPTGGSVVLAAVMLKIGGYGLLRFALPITPDAAAHLDWLVIALSLIAIVYIGFVALAQSDMKKLIAYSSISHMGFVTLGMFLAFAIARNTGELTGAGLGISGAMVQMISHGFISGAMFLAVGVLYDRVHSREISAYGGVANTMPWFAMFAVLFFMANSGLPGTSGFVGEFMVILAAFHASFWFAFAAAVTLILGAAYSLWLVKRVFYGEVANDNVASLKDLEGREWFMLTVLAVFTLGLGLWPYPLIELMEPSVQNLVEHIMQSKLG